MAKRKLPNVLVCGTPGTGKSSLCEAVAAKTPMKHYAIGAIAKEKGYHAGKDAQYDTLLLDEASMDKICDELEGPMAAGGVLLEHHSVDYFPERWFDLVLVLTCDNTVLFDRLKARGYSQAKVAENVEAEILRVVPEEALECYKQEIVHELASSTVEEMEGNAARIEAWLQAWLADHPEGVEVSSGPGEGAGSSSAGSSGR